MTEPEWLGMVREWRVQVASDLVEGARLFKMGCDNGWDVSMFRADLRATLIAIHADLLIPELVARFDRTLILRYARKLPVAAQRELAERETVKVVETTASGADLREVAPERLSRAQIERLFVSEHTNVRMRTVDEQRAILEKQESKRRESELQPSRNIQWVVMLTPDEARVVQRNEKRHGLNMQEYGRAALLNGPGPTMRVAATG